MNNRNNGAGVSPANNFAVFSFFVAILAIVFCFMPLVSFVLILVSVILGVSAYREGNRGGAVAGMAISVLAFLITVIVWASTGSLMCGVGGKKVENSDFGYDEDTNYEEVTYSDLSDTDTSMSDFVSEADLYPDAE